MYFLPLIYLIAILGIGLGGEPDAEMNTGLQLKSGTMDNMVSDFSFVISAYNTTRQWGKCLNVIVSYRYPSLSHTIDYRDLRNKALQYLEPTKELPMNAQWEAVNMVYVQDMMKFYNISGISSQIQVQNRITNEIAEPGNHGSTITAGNALPLWEPLVNSFQYDCTKYSSLEEYQQQLSNEPAQAPTQTPPAQSNDVVIWRNSTLVISVLFLVSLIFNIYTFFKSGGGDKGTGSSVDAGLAGLAQPSRSI